MGEPILFGINYREGILEKIVAHEKKEHTRHPPHPARDV